MSPEDVAGEEVTGYMLGRSIPAIHRLKKTTIVFCGCGKVAIIRIFWTTNKPGRRFYGCQEQTIPADFVRMHGLWRYYRCLLLVDGYAHPMELHVHGDKRMELDHPEHVVMNGAFEVMKEVHNWTNNHWPKFTFDDEARYHEFNVVFQV